MRDKNMSCIVPEKYEVTTYEKDGEIIIEVRLILRWICGKLGTIKEITGFGEIEEAESNIREMIRGKIIKINITLRHGEVSPPIIVRGRAPRGVEEIAILPTIYYEVNGEIKHQALEEKRKRIEHIRKREEIKIIIRRNKQLYEGYAYEQFIENWTGREEILKRIKRT